MTIKTTMISIRVTEKERLEGLKRFENESFNSIIKRILDDYKEVV